MGSSAGRVLKERKPRADRKQAAGQGRQRRGAQEGEREGDTGGARVRVTLMCRQGRERVTTLKAIGRALFYLE